MLPGRLVLITLYCTVPAATFVILKSATPRSLRSAAAHNGRSCAAVSGMAKVRVIGCGDAAAARVNAATKPAGMTYSLFTCLLLSCFRTVVPGRQSSKSFNR
jgi:hypothetical protein